MARFKWKAKWGKALASSSVFPASNTKIRAVHQFISTFHQAGTHGMPYSVLGEGEFLKELEPFAKGAMEFKKMPRGQEQRQPKP
jgi:hypothetical protein